MVCVEIVGQGQVRDKNVKMSEGILEYDLHEFARLILRGFASPTEFILERV
jgi:hypothetical protein